MSEIFKAIENKDHLSILLFLPSQAKEIDESGESVLMYLCRYGLFQHIDYAVNCGAEIHDKDNGDWNALHHAIWRRCKKTVEIILKYGPDPKARDTEQDTSIDLAIRYSSLEILKMLVDVGANTDIYNSIGQSLLFRCNADTTQEMLDYLLEDLNQDINHQDDDGNTPLIYAAQWHQDILVKMLLERNADKSIPNALGKTYHTYLKSKT